MTSLDPPTVRRDGEPVAGSSSTKSDAWHEESRLLLRHMRNVFERPLRVGTGLTRVDYLPSIYAIDIGL